MRKGILAFAAVTMMAGTALTPVEPVHAQIPAFLPNKDAVAETEAMEIDGDWRVNTIDRVIRIERGRAYAVEGWTHALVLKVQPDMVTIRNIRQINETEYVGDDLPMMGRVTLRVVSPGRIEATVPGLFGPARYTLTREASALDQPSGAPPMFQTAPAVRPDGSPRGSMEPARPAQPALRPAIQFDTIEEAFGELRPIPQTFRGCEVPSDARQMLSAPAPSPSPRDRITGREFAPVADANPTVDSDDGKACWTRLDGVWSEFEEPNFDTSKNDGREWGVEGESLASLLHGTYTTPDTLFIAPGDDPETELYVMSGTNSLRMARFASDDGKTIESLIGRVGATKVYTAQENTALGQDLTIDYTAGGDLRVRLGGRWFQRLPAATTRDTDVDDVFALQYQTDNFSANLKGYDVLTQDPFKLMNNQMNAVFARRAPTEYRIQEKFAVPFGFKLKSEFEQGTVFRSSLITKATDVQTSNSSTMGGNVNVSVSGAANSVLSFFSPGQIADTGFSVGNSSTRATMNALRQSDSVGQVIGYSRTKSYAIILNHAEAKLSPGFLTAVSDAQREGRYDELIQRFGTHYAYAATYGSNGKMTKEISRKAFQQALAQTNGNTSQSEIRVLGSSVSGFKENLKSGIETTSGEVENESGTFEAVGGNGSWNEGGFARGERVVPILLDLRPLDELLNPINFPDQPEVYTRVRTELALAINRYLATNAQPLSNQSLTDGIRYVPPPPPAPPPPPPKEEEPEKEQEWHVYIKSIDCIKARGDGKLGVEGTVSINVIAGGTDMAQTRRLEAKCKKRSTTRTDYGYNRRTAQEGLLVLRGTQSELRNHKIRVSYKWDYKPGWKKTTSTVDLFLRDYFNLSDGKFKEIAKRVSKKNNPDLSIQVRVRNADDN